jgi:hypothetical protein
MFSLIGYIQEITDEKLRAQLYALHGALQSLIETVPASIKYHHNWTGGYQDHVLQVIERAVGLYHQLYTNEETMVPSDFRMDDVILVAYIHDLDKLFRYQKVKEPKDGREWDYVKDYPAYDESAKVATMCAQYGIILEDKHLGALAMHHGGWSSNPNRTMSPLAVIIHSADLMSTFITNHKGD